MIKLKTFSSWKVKYEVTFYGKNIKGYSFRKIKENSILFNEEFEIKNSVPFDTKENVEINFLLWVDGLPTERLVALPNDYYDKQVRYDEESVEVLEVMEV